MRVPDVLMEHRIAVRRRQPIGGAYESAYDVEVPDIPALVSDKSSLIVDERVEAQTRGSQILSTGSVLLHAEDWIPVGSLVRIWPGTARERTLEVIKTDYQDHSMVPAYAKAWLV